MAEERDESGSYITRCKCGCGGIKAAVVDDPERRSDTAKEIGKWIRDGYRVESITTQAAREQSWGCPLEKAEKARRATPPDVTVGPQLALEVE